MTMLMGVRDDTLSRACDLGVAMQLTNIARDVGEDAQRGRVYLPARWLEEAGVDPASLGAAPRFTPALGGVVQRLLDHAEEIYLRAEPGIPGSSPLPRRHLRSAADLRGHRARHRGPQIRFRLRPRDDLLPQKLWLLLRALVSPIRRDGPGDPPYASRLSARRRRAPELRLPRRALDAPAAHPEGSMPTTGLRHRSRSMDSWTACPRWPHKDASSSSRVCKTASPPGCASPRAASPPDRPGSMPHPHPARGSSTGARVLNHRQVPSGAKLMARS